MKIVLIVCAIVIFVSVIGVVINISLSFSVLKNSGRLTIKLFRIPVVSLKIKIQGNILKLTRKKKPINFKLNSQNIRLLDLLKKNVVHRIYVNSLNVDAYILLTNPAVACLLSSTMLSVFAWIKFKIIKHQEDACVSTNVLTGFEGNQIVFMFDLNIIISIIDLIWAVIKTLFERRKWYGKKYRKFDY